MDWFILITCISVPHEFFTILFWIYIPILKELSYIASSKNANSGKGLLMGGNRKDCAALLSSAPAGMETYEVTSPYTRPLDNLTRQMLLFCKKTVT